MNKLHQFLESAQAGSHLSLGADDFGIADAAFHALVKGWERDGGDGFHVYKTHQESQTGNRWIDFVVIQKD
ncbi:hypothetical protein [Delftia acidovorans]|uniref:hypothetical protein n=1 Tax=Delftia acidovorans TaxID=80866 RepID=UPI001EDD96BC|nr:hypothetical protein [Delftia acidovorans]MCG3784597.1 hypothetical protein [Delftia acidovorans]